MIPSYSAHCFSFAIIRIINTAFSPHKIEHLFLTQKCISSILGKGFKPKNTCKYFDTPFPPPKRKGARLFVLTPFLKIGRVKFPLSKLPNLRIYRFRASGKPVFSFSIPPFHHSKHPGIIPHLDGGWSSYLTDHSACPSLPKKSKKNFTTIAALSY